MVSRWVRTWYSRPLRPLLEGLARAGLTPNQLTAASLLLIVAAAVALGFGEQALGGGLLLAGAILDGLDGELARVLRRETALGGLLDSIADHCGDFAVHLGLLWWFVTHGARLEPVLLFTSLFGSMLGSQIRSRAGMLGVDTKTTGWATRFERNAVLLAGLWTGYLGVALWVLAALTGLSAAQRLWHMLQFGRPARPAAKQNAASALAPPNGPKPLD